MDDPFAYGRIAAANSLSDVYAMGGRPVTAMNILCFPDDVLPAEIAAEIVRGGDERVRTAGAVTVGGHSVRDTEIKYGLAVTGLVDPARVVTNAGARPGDILILTKPLGSGVLATAFRAGKIDESQLAESVDCMIDLNAAASEAMVEVGVSAATDVTGFGLLGHGLELALASGVTLEIDAASVPLLTDVTLLARKRHLTRSHRATLEHVASHMRLVGDVDDVLVKILADAQTSGGLLIALPADRVDAYGSSLESRSPRPAVAIGRVVPKEDSAILLR